MDERRRSVTEGVTADARAVRGPVRGAGAERGTAMRAYSSALFGFSGSSYRPTRTARQMRCRWDGRRATLSARARWAAAAATVAGVLEVEAMAVAMAMVVTMMVRA